MSILGYEECQNKIQGIYEEILNEDNEDAEAHWGLVLSKFGIEYVDDPATAKKIPTCHRASFESLQKDENFGIALEYAYVAFASVKYDLLFNYGNSLKFLTSSAAKTRFKAYLYKKLDINIPPIISVNQ